MRTKCIKHTLHVDIHMEIIHTYIHECEYIFAYLRLEALVVWGGAAQIKRKEVALNKLAPTHIRE